jgi:hypothetical protein
MPAGSLIHGAGELAGADSVLAAEALLGAVDVGVDGFEGVWALAARAAAARMRARTNRFMAGQIPGWIPKRECIKREGQRGGGARSFKVCSR